MSQSTTDIQQCDRCEMYKDSIDKTGLCLVCRDYMHRGP